MVLVEQELLKIFFRPRTIWGIGISRAVIPTNHRLGKNKVLLIV